MKQSIQLTISDASNTDTLDVPVNYGRKSTEKFRQGANFGHRVFTEKCRGNKYYAWKYLDKVCAEKRLSPFKAGDIPLRRF